MSEFPDFPGFPEEGMQFLEDLAANNNRVWFEAHKQVYLDHLLDPAQRFVMALGERLKTLSDGIVYDTATSGSGSIMRIYRDLRFRKDKTPYKTYLRVVFWEGAARRTENPGLYFSMDANGGGIFVGVHEFSGPVLAVYRDAVVDERAGSDLAAALDAVRSAGDYRVGGEHYKRVPRGYDPDHARADLLRYNALYAMSPSIPAPLLSTPALVELCFEHCRNMMPLHRWLVGLYRRAGA